MRGEAAAASLVENGFTTMFQGYVFEKDKTWSAPFAGLLRFDFPNSWKKASGTIKATGGSENIPGSGLSAIDILYFTMPAAEYDKLIREIAMYSVYAQTDTNALLGYNAAARKYTSSMTQLGSIYAFSRNAPEDDARSRLKEIYTKYGGSSAEEADALVDAYTIIPAGSAADYNFFIVQTDKDAGNAFTDGNNIKYKEEYERLHENIKEIIPGLTFARPMGITELKLSDDGLKFSSSDLLGNPLTNEDLFAGHKVTMLNIWSTTCSVCYTEIPELQKIHEEFTEKGGQVAGLLYDGDDPELAHDAQLFLDEYGITYPNVSANEELKAAFPTQSFPMTYFFDENGNLIGDPVIGANLKEYRELMEKYTQAGE